MQIGKSTFLGYGGAIAIAGVAALTSYHPLLQVAIVLAAAGCGYWGVRSHIAQIECEHRALADAESEKGEQFLLQTVNRMRHDVLNDLQVLFGYIQLKKYDNLQPSMENIKTKMVQESFVSRLGIPALVAYLITARSSVAEFDLEVELEEELNLAKLPLKSETVSAATRELIGLFQTASVLDAGAFAQNVLSLQFAVEEDALLLDFMYRGDYERDSLEQAIDQLLKTAGSEIAEGEMIFDEREAAVTLIMPFRA